MADSSPDRGPLDPHAIEIATAYLQVVLNAIASYDGKTMFLTALHVAAIVAFVSLQASTETHPALFWSGIGCSGLAILTGLCSLWTVPAFQFPTPAVVMGLALRDDIEDDRASWIYLAIIRRSTRIAAPIIARKSKAWRGMILLTPISVALLLATVTTSIGPAESPTPATDQGETEILPARSG